MSYHDLVVALGSVSRTLPIPGLADHALGFKSLADAIHSATTSCDGWRRPTPRPNETHRHRELTFVFVGAGYAGVEALAELSDLVRDALKLLPRLQTRPSAGCSSTQRRRSSRRSRGRSASTRPRSSSGAASRSTSRQRSTRSRRTRPSSPNGERILTHTLVWTAGVRAHPLLSQFGLPLDEKGRVIVDETLAVEGHEHVWALGDGARVPNLATPGNSTRRRASTRCVRPGGWRRTSGRAEAVPLPHARPGGDARPLQGNRRRDGPAADAASSAGSSPARITSTNCPCSRGSCASSPTGRPRSSSAATSPSCRCSAIPAAARRCVTSSPARYAFLARGDMGGSRTTIRRTAAAVYTDELPKRLGLQLPLDRPRRRAGRARRRGTSGSSAA